MATGDSPNEDTRDFVVSQEEVGYQKEESSLVVSGKHHHSSASEIRKRDQEESVLDVFSSSEQWTIDKEHFLKDGTNMKKVWKKRTSIDGKIKAKIEVILVSKLSSGGDDRAPVLIVSIKITKNRSPEYKYQAIAIASLSGANLLGRQNQSSANFQEGDDMVKLMVRLDEQRAIEESTDAALKLDFGVEVCTRSMFKCREEEEGFLLVDLKKEEESLPETHTHSNTPPTN